MGKEEERGGSTVLGVGRRGDAEVARPGCAARPALLARVRAWHDDARWKKSCGWGPHVGERKTWLGWAGSTSPTRVCLFFLFYPYF